MATLPKTLIALPTIEAIFSSYEKEKRGHRVHLGASSIGRPCDRDLWYGFRHCLLPRFEGRVLRLFETGELEEKRLVRNLRRLGINVLDRDPATGNQFRVSAHGGHFGGSLDGVAQGFIESTKWHLLEFKTSNAKRFASLSKEGLERTNPEHYAQMQIYMCLADLTRGFYLAVNKDNDAIYGERVRRDKKIGKYYLERAKRIIFAQYPPSKISQDGSWYQCRFCSHSPICHEGEYPEPSCRNCLHTTPEEDGSWSCAEKQETGKTCPRHLFIPDLLGEPVEACAKKVVYLSGLVNLAGGQIK